MGWALAQAIDRQCGLRQRQIMKKYFLLAAFLVLPFASQATLTADEVVQNQINMNKGYVTEKAVGQMLIYNESGSHIDREFTMMQIEEQGAESYKAMIKVNQPTDLKGTGLLTYQNKAGEDDQWLYLPAMKKTRRISGSARGGKFLGSDFNFEDLSPKQKEDFTYQTLRVEPCETTNCYVIQSTPKDAASLYSKTISWVREDNFLAVKMEVYDQNQQLIKLVTFSDYQQHDGKYWRPSKIVMQDLQKQRRTELMFSDVQIGKGISAGDFSKQALER